MWESFQHIRARASESMLREGWYLTMTDGEVKVEEEEKEEGE